MCRIGVVTSDIERDWASRQLIDAANRLCDGVMVDPMTFEIRTEGPCPILVNGEPLDSFAAFIVRGFDKQGQVDYQNEIFEILEQRGKLVINSTPGLSIAESKAQTTYCLEQAGLPVPRTRVTQKLDEAMRFVSELGRAVVKPLYGSHGVGIERVGPDDEEAVTQVLDEHGVAYIQEYIDNPGRDIRAFVVGDDIPAAMYRVAPEGQWKTNVYQGSTCEHCELSPKMRELCIESSRIIGLDYTGVDVIEGPDGPVVLELNGAPSWYGLATVTDRDLAEDIVKHVMRILRIGKMARRPVGFGFWWDAPSGLESRG